MAFLLESGYVNDDGVRSTRFSALLKSAEGEMIEEGTALCSIENGSVDFAGDFIPLFPMGTPLTVVRVYQGNELQTFRGEVYLSSKKLLRITAVSEQLLPGSERFFLFSMKAQKGFAVSSASEPLPKPEFFLFRRPGLSPPPRPVSIFRAAWDAVEFRTFPAFSVGEELSLSFSLPEEKYVFRLPVKVLRALKFGTGSCCFCHILTLPSAERNQWDRLIQSLHREQTPLFIPASNR